jgi:predicted Zn finger-like uncharacterized protein
MIEIQCTSCHTRYRIDERVLPDETPTFKCSRCGHVFTAEPVPSRRRKAEPDKADRGAKSPSANVSAPSAQHAQEPPPPAPQSRDEAETPANVDTSAAEETEERRTPAFVANKSVDAPATAGPRAPDTGELPRSSAPRHQEPPSVSEEPAPTDDPLNKSFEDPAPRGDTGENLKFDFTAERGAPREEPEREFGERDDRNEGWQVGEPDEDPRPRRRVQPAMDIDDVPPAPQDTRTARGRAQFAAGADLASSHETVRERQRVPDDVSFIEDPSSIHSSAYFIGVFFIVAVGFFVFSLFINGEPAASVKMIGQLPVIGSHFAPPLIPATLVALEDVHVDSRTLKGGQSALVVTGNARNAGNRPLHAIQIEVLLLNQAQQSVARAQTYCGNDLSPRMFDEMTPRELEFSLGLNPPKNFSLDPAQVTPFMLVFRDPPREAKSLRIAVTQADPAAEPITASSN